MFVGIRPSTEVKAAKYFSSPCYMAAASPMGPSHFFSVGMCVRVRRPLGLSNIRVCLVADLESVGRSLDEHLGLHGGDGELTLVLA